MSGPQFTATPCDTCDGLCVIPGFGPAEPCGTCDQRGWVVLPVKVPMAVRPCWRHAQAGHVHGCMCPPAPDLLWDPDQPYIEDCPKCGGDSYHASAPGPNEPTDEYDCNDCGHQFRRRRSAPIVTPCDICTSDAGPPEAQPFCDGCEVVGRCSWTLAPVVSRLGYRYDWTGLTPFLMLNETTGMVRLWHDKKGVSMSPVADRVRAWVSENVSPGDWVAIPEVTS